MTACLDNVGSENRRASSRASLLAIPLVAAWLGPANAPTGAKAQAPNEASPIGKAAPAENNYAIRGQCVKHVDNSPMASVGLRLYHVGGPGSLTIEVAKTLSGRDGRFAFTGLPAPRFQSHLDRLEYGLVAYFDGRPLAIHSVPFHERDEPVTIHISSEWATLSGKVIDTDGRPVEGATVVRFFLGGQPVPGLSATTDVEGRFKLDDMRVLTKPTSIR